jgi:arylsulfatase A-like enzyme/1-acyl-sn-glycerol-3-phosphate acyltransferase
VTPPRRSRAEVAAIVLAYTLVFCVALPVGLLAAGFRLDALAGWRPAPTPLGALPAVWGGWLLGRGMWALWTDAGGWPISALPPPRLATGGPYRVVRHPIYLGFQALLVGVGLLVGSLGTVVVAGPLFLPVWLAYAAREERGLRRRFGAAWDRYASTVGRWPRPSLRQALWLLRALGVLRVRVTGLHHLPRRGPVVIVANHTTYADPVWLALAVPRVLWMATTAEAYRTPGAFRWMVRFWPTFPVRRYRSDPAAARAMLGLLGAGEAVGLFVERERSVLGRYQGADPAIAPALARLAVPVVPVALQGGYATGPRWAATLRIPTLHARVGPPIAFGDEPAAAAIDRALRALLAEDPQRVWLEREPLDRLATAVWRCPACGDEPGWRPAALRCEACGASAAPSGDGRVRTAAGVVSFADWAAPAWARVDPLPMRARVRASREGDDATAPLVDEGEVELVLGPDGLSWGSRRLAPAEIRSTSTERADTLQIGAAAGMWQFRAAGWSPFRWRIAVDRLRGAPTPGLDPLPPAPPPAPPAPEPPPPAVAGAATGLGMAVVEGGAVLLPLSAMHGQAGLAAAVVPATLACVAGGAVLDRLGAALRAPPWVAGVAAAVALGAAGAGTGQPWLVAALGAAAALGWGALARDRARWPLAAVVAAWCLSPALPRPAPLRPPPGPVGATGPSIALIVLDTVRADRTSLARRDRDPTPHLAALAARGTTFASARSVSCWSLPAHATLLTGRLPSGHGAHFEHFRLDADADTLPEALRAAGWDTAAFSGNPLVAPGTGLDQGFVTFEEAWRGWLGGESTLAGRVARRWLAPERDKGGAAVAAAVRAWRRSRPDDRPWFALVNVFEAHAPYPAVPAVHRDAFLPPGTPAAEVARVGEAAHLAQVFGTPVDERDAALARDLSDGAVRAADAVLGEVLAALSDADVVIVVSDHGEELGGPRGWGHDHGLSEPILRVPFVVAGPGIAAGRTIDAPVSLVDVAPTIRALAGLPPDPGDGVDLSPALRGGEGPGVRTLRAEHWRTDPFTGAFWVGRPWATLPAVRARRAAAVRGDVKRVRAEDGTDEGFDLAADPDERRPFPGAATGLDAPLPEAP